MLPLGRQIPEEGFGALRIELAPCPSFHFSIKYGCPRYLFQRLHDLGIYLLHERSLPILAIMQLAIFGISFILMFSRCT